MAAVLVAFGLGLMVGLEELIQHYERTRDASMPPFHRGWHTGSHKPPPHVARHIVKCHDFVIQERTYNR